MITPLTSLFRAFDSLSASRASSRPVSSFQAERSGWLRRRLKALPRVRRLGVARLPPLVGRRPTHPLPLRGAIEPSSFPAEDCTPASALGSIVGAGLDVDLFGLRLISPARHSKLLLCVLHFTEGAQQERSVGEHPLKRFHRCRILVHERRRGVQRELEEMSRDEAEALAERARVLVREDENAYRPVERCCGRGGTARAPTLCAPAVLTSLKVQSLAETRTCYSAPVY